MWNGNHTFEIYNFGCKVNQEEGGALAALFAASGWQRAAEGEDAGLIIINTCTVTQVADKKARNLIRRLRREQPGCILAVCGCYAQRAAEEIHALGGVDIVAGVDERARLPELVEAYIAEQQSKLTAVSDIAKSERFVRIADSSDQQRTRAYLKIEDGCDQFCHYCVIPYVRGPVRSLPEEQVLEQARKLLDKGCGEIILSGIHIGAYGQDFGMPHALPELMEKLLAMPGLVRLRLGSIEPQQFTPQLIALLGEDKLCPHFHIPLQSGCDRTLQAMGRHYLTADYAALLERIRAVTGDAAFTSDVMVGYPGESEEDFLQSMAFCESCGFADLHIFPYSRRQGTVAADMPNQVLQKNKADRAARLAAVAARAAETYQQRYLGKPLLMLAEEEVEINGQRYVRGHSGNYLKLLLPCPVAEADRYTVYPQQITEEGLVCSLAMEK